MTLSLLLYVVSLAFTLVNAQASGYGQCGGQGWTGPTNCVAGWTCIVSNPYYSQCLPSTSSTAPPGTTAPSTTGLPGGGQTSSTATAPVVTATGAWATAIAKAKTAVAKLTNAQKASIGTGIGWQKGVCVGNTAAISTINFPGLCLQDGPVGVRDTDFNSVFPAAINVAATFNRQLMNARGVALGQEFKGKGVNVALGPMMNLARAPAAGRNWEGFGPDPYLSGEGAYQTVTGIQSAGVQACAKHYINNEQEHSRDHSSSNVDDRTQHELYLHPFLKAVQAGVASFMCSYNQINGTYSCSNSQTINNLLKGELGFQGYMMSDWWATHSTQDAAAGLDMTMPGDISASSGTTYFGQNLVNAVNSGTVSQTRLDDMATRVLAAWYLLGQDSGFPSANLNSWNSGGSHVNVQSNHSTIIRQIGSASVVLLKNTNDMLPLKNVTTLAVVGDAAGAGSGPNSCGDRACDSGVLGIGWGSGTANFPYLTTPLSAITNRASANGILVSSSLSDTNLSSAASVSRGKSAAIVFITSDSGEGYLTVEGNEGDRNNLQAWHSGDALVQQVASNNPNTIVVINSVGPIIVEPWVQNVNVTAILWMGLPGQEGGSGVTDVLFGDVNPSGRLPFTIAKSVSDYSASVIYTDATGSNILQIPYSEGMMIDYFHFDQAATAPRFEFGFGLSYTSFSYSGLNISGTTAGGSPPIGPGSSLDPWLHSPVVTVTFKLTNTGSIPGTEIPQLYISLPTSSDSPPKKLKGFESVYLTAGASTTVTMSLSRYDFSIWNTGRQQWTVVPGSTTISIGASSRDLRLSANITN